MTRSRDTSRLAVDGLNIIPFNPEATYGAGTAGNAIKDYSKAITINAAFWGAVADDATDNHTVLQDALAFIAAQGGGTLFIPAGGTFRIAQALDIPGQSVRIAGETRFGSIVKQTNLSAPMIESDFNFTQIENLTLIYSGTPLAGATAIRLASTFSTVKNVAVRSSYVAIDVSGSGNMLSDLLLLDYESVGLLAHDCNDLYLSDFLFNAGNATRGALGGIRLVGKVEAFVAVSGDILVGQFSMTSDGPNTLGNRAAYNSFVSVYFDSAANSTAINEMVETEFIACWFSGGRSGAGNAGSTINDCTSIRFVSCRWFNCGAAGHTHGATNRRVYYIGCSWESNSATTGPGVAHGLSIADNSQSVFIENPDCSNGLYTGQQGYGIVIGTGSSKIRIRDGSVEGNLTGGILNGSSAANDVRIVDVVGYRNRSYGTATIPIASSSVVVAHTLVATPSRVVLTPRGIPNSRYGATARNGTNFTISQDSAVSGADQLYDWEAFYD